MGCRDTRAQMEEKTHINDPCFRRCNDGIVEGQSKSLRQENNCIMANQNLFNLTKYFLDASWVFAILVLN